MVTEEICLVRREPSSVEAFFGYLHLGKGGPVDAGGVKESTVVPEGYEPLVEQMVRRGGEHQAIVAA